MDLDDFRISKTIFPLVCKNPKVASHAICGPISASAKESLEMLVIELEGWENSLEIAEDLQDFSQHGIKLQELRGKIASVRGAIAKPLAYATTYEHAKDLLSAVRRINRIDPRTNPLEAAKAYGAAMTSFGGLIELLPPPANAVGTLIAEMGKIFAKVVSDIVPHTRGTNKRLDDEVKRIDGQGLFEPV